MADAVRLQRDQTQQRAMKPGNVAQKIFQDWIGSHMSFLDPVLAADLVKRIERAIIAERANSSSTAEKKG